MEWYWWVLLAAVVMSLTTNVNRGRPLLWRQFRYGSTFKVLSVEQVGPERYALLVVILAGESVPWQHPPVFVTLPPAGENVEVGDVIERVPGPRQLRHRHGGRANLV